MSLLGGVEEKVVKEKEKERREVESEIEKEEVGRVIRKLKDKKAMGKDGRKRSMEIRGRRNRELGMGGIQQGVERRRVARGLEGMGDNTDS